MAKVKFTRHLVRYFPTLGDVVEAKGATVAEILNDLNQRFPGLADYIVDEHGVLRRHVNIFLGKELIHDRKTLSDPVADDAEIHVFQALSGG